MPVTIEEAKERLDYIIRISRVDLYKPIQIAEVLRHSRAKGDVKPLDLNTYRNQSLKWRNQVTQRLAGKVSTSSARYQHDVWNLTAMSPDILSVLDEENRRTDGAIERYIYLRYSERQGTVTEIIAAIEAASPDSFHLDSLLHLFVTNSGIRRSIDKAYEIVTYSLFETIVTGLETKITLSVPQKNHALLKEFADLARVLLGLDANQFELEQDAHIYRVGVTNAADRGLDMWTNFGPAVQVKHLTLNENLATEIVDQVESEHIVIVCRDAEAVVIEAVLKQIGWGRRVRGIVKETNLIDWHERCLRGKFKNRLAKPLLKRLSDGFKAEFPQTTAITEFLEERGYLELSPPKLWLTEIEESLSS